MEEFRTEMRNMFQELAAQLRQTISQPEEDQQQQQQDVVPDSAPEQEMIWTSIMEELPAVPAIANTSWAKIYKLAKELRRRAAFMTAGRDLHDIHTVLFLVAHWIHLEQPARNYAAHRLRLLYVAITKG
jgi:hypothetical protein